MIFFPTESLIFIAGFFAAACLYGYYNFMEIGSEQMDLLRRDFWFKKANTCRRWSIIFIILAVAFGISASIIPAIV
uniref:Membrane protein n=1 Tax=Klebsiella phage vB_Kpn9-P3 TaxID=3230856 RepID=A0AAU8EHD4_9VIRU